MEGQQVDLNCDHDSIASLSAREKRLRRRRLNHKEMTEDEMIQLALRLSEPEASAYSLREEEDDVRKAIHQSMTEQTAELLIDEPGHQPGPSKSQQDFLNGGSISSSSQESLTPSHRTVSPTFPRTPCSPPEDMKRTTYGDKHRPVDSDLGRSRSVKYLRRLPHREGPAESDTPEVISSDDMTLRGSDEDESATGSQSPIFNHETACNQTAVNGPNSGSSKAGSCVDPQQTTGESRPTVQYYWGVPFCPRSLSPDKYTQVIVTQLDTYSRSLKEARRLLLRKAEWGDGILPGTDVGSSSWPDEPSLLTESGDGGSQCADAPEASRGVDEDLQDMDFDTCPETQLSIEDDEDCDEQGSEAAAAKSSASPDHVMEAAALECGLKNTRISPAHEEELENTEEHNSSPSDVEEVHEGKSGDSISAVPSSSSRTTVNCPICQLPFPLADVEMHAAYCEGDKRKCLDDRDPEFMVRPRKRSRLRRGEAAAESVLEKCYVCQQMVPLSSYSAHTELCTQLPLKASRRTLLSALEQTDSADIAHRGSGLRQGPSGSGLQPSTRVDPNDIIELQDDDEEEEEGKEEDCLRRAFIKTSKSGATFRRTLSRKPKR